MEEEQEWEDRADVKNLLKYRVDVSHQHSISFIM